MTEEQPLLIDAKAAREIVLPALRLYYRANPYAPAEAEGGVPAFNSLHEYKMTMPEAKEFHQFINSDGQFALLWGTVLSQEYEWDDGASRGPATLQNGSLVWRT